MRYNLSIILKPTIFHDAFIGYVTGFLTTTILMYSYKLTADVAIGRILKTGFITLGEVMRV